jgi:hypothetical protein
MTDEELAVFVALLPEDQARELWNRLLAELEESQELRGLFMPEQKCVDDELLFAKSKARQGK